MKFVLILDTETTGVDPKTDRAIEVAAVQYSLEHACVMESYASLICAEENPAEAINHIPGKALPFAMDDGDVWRRVRDMASRCDAIVAHNAAFDRRFVPESLRDCVPWICTLSGFDWPRAGDDRKLISIALAHGLGVVDPHRALADCYLIARLLTRCAELGTDIGAMLERGLRPQATFQALVSFENKDLAKAKGFQWDPKGRRWVREMAIEDAVPEVLGFEVRRIAATVEI